MNCVSCQNHMFFRYNSLIHLHLDAMHKNAFNKDLSEHQNSFTYFIRLSKMTLWCWFINFKIIIQLTIKMSMLNCSMQLAGEREAEIAAKVQIIVIANNFSMQFMSKINYIKICLLTFILKYCETRHRACINFSTLDYCIKVF